jgi:hypothetical protein
VKDIRKKVCKENMPKHIVTAAVEGTRKRGKPRKNEELRLKGTLV